MNLPNHNMISQDESSRVPTEAMSLATATNVTGNDASNLHLVREEEDIDVDLADDLAPSRPIPTIASIASTQMSHNNEGERTTAQWNFGPLDKKGKKHLPIDVVGVPNVEDCKDENEVVRHSMGFDKDSK